MAAGPQPVSGEPVSGVPVIPAASPPEVVAPAAIDSPAEHTKVRTRWESWMHAVFTLREDRFFLMLAVIIGVFSGLVVVCFRLAIEWTQITLLGPSLSPSFPRVVLAPTIAGIVVALLAIQGAAARRRRPRRRRCPR
jgi:CIC family chloride channel protein